MPVGDRRSAVRLAWRRVVGAGFALPRDAGRRPALHAAPALQAWWRTAECAKKTNGSELRSLPASSGESVKGGILPFHKKVMTHRNLPPRARGYAVEPGYGELGVSPVARGCWCGFRAPARCRSETGAPRRPRASSVVAYCRVREKNKRQRTPFAAGEFGGKCERGDSPLSQSVTTNRNSPPRAVGAQGSFDCRREAPGGCRMGPGLPWVRKPGPNPLSGPIREPLGGSSRREAPGGSGGGLNSLPLDHPNPSSDVPPSRTARPSVQQSVHD